MQLRESWSDTLKIEVLIRSDLWEEIRTGRMQNSVYDILGRQNMWNQELPKINEESEELLEDHHDYLSQREL